MVKDLLKCQMINKEHVKRGKLGKEDIIKVVHKNWVHRCAQIWCDFDEIWCDLPK